MGRRGRQRRRRLLPPRRRRRPASAIECTLVARGTRSRPASAEQLLEWGDAHRHRARRRHRRRQGRLLPCRPLTARSARRGPPTGFGPGFAARGRRRRRRRPRVGGLQRRRQGRLLPRRSVPRSPARSPPAAGSAARVSSPTIDVGYEAGRTWADIDGDGRADYCRRVGDGGADPAHRCTLATATGFGADFIVRADRVGRGRRHAWVGLRRRRRPRLLPPRRGQPDEPQLFCTLWTPTGFGADDRRPARSTSATRPAARGWTTTATARSTTAACVGGGADTARGLHDLDRHRVRPGPRARAAARPAPARPRARARTGQEDAARRHALLRLQRQGPLDAAHPPAGQGRPGRRDGQGHVQEGLLAQVATRSRRRRAGASRSSAWSRKRLRAGTTIRVVVSRPGNLAAIKTLSIRASKRPTVKTG